MVNEEQVFKVVGRQALASPVLGEIQICLYVQDGTLIVGKKKKLSVYRNIREESCKNNNGGRSSFRAPSFFETNSRTFLHDIVVLSSSICLSARLSVKFCMQAFHDCYNSGVLLTF